MATILLNGGHVLNRGPTHHKQAIRFHYYKLSPCVRSYVMNFNMPQLQKKRRLHVSLITITRLVDIKGSNHATENTSSDPQIRTKPAQNNGGK